MKLKSLQKHIYKSRKFLLSEGKYSSLRQELLNNLPKIAEESPIRIFNYFRHNNKKIPEQFYEFITLEDNTGYGIGLTIYDIFKLHYHFIKKNQEIPLELSNVLENIKNKKVTYHNAYSDVFANPYKAWVDYLYATGEIVEYRIAYLPRYVYTLHSKNKPIDPFVQYWLDNTSNGRNTKIRIFHDKVNPLDDLKEHMPEYAELYLKESTNILQEGKYDDIKNELVQNISNATNGKALSKVMSALFKKYYDKDELDSDTFKSMFKAPYNRIYFMDTINSLIKSKLIDGSLENKKSFMPFLLSTPSLLKGDATIISSFLKNYKNESSSYWLGKNEMDKILTILIEQRPSAFIGIMWEELEKISIDQLLEKYKKYINLFEESIDVADTNTIAEYMRLLYSYGKIPSDYIFEKFKSIAGHRNSLVDYAYRLLYLIVRQHILTQLDNRLVEIVATSYDYSKEFLKNFFYEKNRPTSIPRSWKYELPNAIVIKASEERSSNKEDDVYESTIILQEGKYSNLKEELIDSISNNSDTSAKTVFAYIKSNKPVPEKIFKTISKDVFSAENLAVKLIAYNLPVPEILIDKISTYSGFSRDLAMTMVSKGKFQDIPEKILNGITKPEDAEEFSSKLYRHGYTIPDHILELVLNSKEERTVKNFLNTMGGNKEMSEVALELWNYSWKRVLENKELKILNIILEVIKNGDGFQIPDFVFKNDRINQESKHSYSPIDYIVESFCKYHTYYEYGSKIESLIPYIILEIIEKNPSSSYYLATNIINYKVGLEIPQYVYSSFIEYGNYCFNFLAFFIDYSKKNYIEIDVKQKIPKELVQNAIKWVEGEGRKYFKEEGAIEKYIKDFTNFSSSINESTIILQEGKYDDVRDEIINKLISDDLDIHMLYDFMFKYFKHNKMNSISLKKMVSIFYNSFGEEETIKLLKIFTRNEIDRVIRDYYIGWGHHNTFVDFILQTPLLLNNNFDVVYDFIKEVYMNNQIMDVIKKKYPDSIARFEKEKQKRIKEGKEKQEKQEIAYAEHRKRTLKSLGIEESVNVLGESKYDNLRKELYDNMLSNPKIASRYGERLIQNKKEIPDDILNTIANDEDLSASIASEYIDSLKKHPPKIIIQRAALRPSSSWALASTFLDNNLEVPKILIDMIARNSYHAWRYAKRLLSSYDMFHFDTNDSKIPDNIFKKVMEDDVYKKRFMEQLQKELEAAYLTPVKNEIIKKRYFERMKPYITSYDFNLNKESTKILQEGKYDDVKDELKKAIISKNKGLRGSLYYKVEDYVSQGDQGKIPDALVDLISQSPSMSTDYINTVLRWNHSYIEKEKVEDLIPKSILYGAIKDPSYNAGFSKTRFDYIINLIKGFRFEIPEIYKRLVSVEVPIRNESTNILQEGKYDGLKMELAKSLGELYGSEESDEYSDKLEDLRSKIIDKINKNKKIPEWYLHVEKSRAFQYLADLVNRWLSGNKLLIDLHERKLVQYAYSDYFDINAVQIYIDFLIERNKPIDKILYLIYEFGDKKDVEDVKGNAYNTYLTISDLLVKNINYIHLIPIKILDVASSYPFYSRMIVEQILKEYDKLEKKFEIPTFMFKNITKDHTENFEFVRNIIRHNKFNVPDLNVKALSEEDKKYFENEMMYDFNK